MLNNPDVTGNAELLECQRFLNRTIRADWDAANISIVVARHNPPLDLSDAIENHFNVRRVGGEFLIDDAVTLEQIVGWVKAGGRATMFIREPDEAADLHGFTKCHGWMFDEQVAWPIDPQWESSKDCQRMYRAFGEELQFVECTRGSWTYDLGKAMFGYRMHWNR